MRGKTAVAIFHGKQYAEKVQLFQYDYGQVLKMPDINLPATYEVHFGNSVNGTAVPQIGNENGVKIPDEIIESAGDKFAWVFLHEGPDDGETEYVVPLHIKARAKNTGAEPTPVQQDAITTAIAALNSGVETVSGIAEAIPQTINDALAEAKASGEFDGPKGDPGEDGTDGISPSVLVTDIAGGHRVSVTDKDGTETFDVIDGIDGVNPSIQVEDIHGGHRVTLTDKDGPVTVDVIDGIDGISPVAVVTKNDGTATISITDKNGTTTAQITDGIDGESGVFVGNTEPSNPNVNVWINPDEGSTDDVADAVADWLVNHPEATTTVQDGSITKAKLDSSLSQTVDDVGDLKSAFNAMSSFYLEENAIDLTPTGYSVIISSTTGKWVSNSSYKSLILTIPTGEQYVKITANSSNNAVFAFLKTDGHTAGDTPDYATGSTRTVINANTTEVFKIPSDANYIFITKTGSVTHTPSSAKYLHYTTIPEVDNTLAVPGDAADAKSVGDKFAEIDDLLYETADADLVGNYSIFINTSSKWSTSYNPASWIIVIPETAKSLTVKANDNYNAIIAFLTTTDHASQTTPDFATGSGRTVISATNTETFSIPSDAKYLYVQKETDGKTNTPTSTTWLKEKDIESATIPLGLHEKPANSNILNIIKRCRQMTDIKWTPAVDLSRLMIVQRGGTVIPNTAESQYYLGTFKAGVEYTGIPYGRVNQSMDQYGYSYGTAGHYVGFDSFISSVSNPKSRISNVNYGSAAGHRSVVYATVCSGMVCYALDVDEVATSNIGNIPGLSLIGKLNNSGTMLSDSSIKIGDILNKYDFHTGIITDIIRDDAGVIQFVEVSEATVKGCSDKNYKDGQMGGLCIRRGWTRGQLFDPYTWGDYNVYRYNGTVPYTPSPYVNVGDEFDSFRIEHFPIMPYEGEGFAYKAGYIPDNAVKLVITLDGYAYVKVFKDGTEISGSPFSVTTTNDEIDPINVTEIGAGAYTAYLCNISNGDVTNLTYACHWSIDS